MYKILLRINELMLLINQCISDYVLVFALLGVGLFYTFKTRFVQIRCFGEGVRTLIKGQRTAENSAKKSGITPVQALFASLGSQLGTGNIVGACSAVVLGGPGAVFWMWIIAFFGMSSAYAEGVIAVKTRKRTPDGSFTGGPVCYITEAFKGKAGKTLSLFFAFSAVMALGFTGSMVQSNAVSEAFSLAFGLNGRTTGIVLAACTGAVMLGGKTGIVKFAEKTVPVMALLFMSGCVAILVMYHEYVFDCLCLIMKSAFSPKSVLGASAGVTVRDALFYGAKRGLFSNEAGMGTSPHAHAMVGEDTSAHKQGLYAMLGVFIDTMVMMTLTAVAVLTVVYCGGKDGDNAFWNANMTQYAFSEAFGSSIGRNFVALCLFFFGFTSILGWSMYGRMNFKYIFGNGADRLYSAAVLLFVFLGCVSQNSLVWNLTDFFNQLMVVPNVAALFALYKKVRAIPR